MLIKMQDITKQYGKTVILDRINLEFTTGKCYGLLGRNGAGKTTLLNCLLDLVKPESGEVFIDNSSISEVKEEFKKNIGVLSDENPLIMEFTGYQYLKFAGSLYGLSGKVLSQRMSSLFNYFFDNPADINKKTGSYSRGMKKKLSLCSAILHKPGILILDEPFSDLDPVAANQIVKFLNSYLNEHRIIIISAHELAYIQQVANQILVLNDGHIIFNGDKETFTNNGQNLIDHALLDLLMAKHKEIAEINWIFE